MRIKMVGLTLSLTLGGVVLCGIMNAQEVKHKSSLFRAHILEAIEVSGTSRMNATDVVEALDLKPGTVLDDDVVMGARQKLLGLGLFKSVILLQKKGSQRGKVRLLVEVEDDPSVMGSWALGGELGLVYSEQDVSSTDPEAPPIGYKAILLGRNLFLKQHRIYLLSDVDSRGQLQEAQAVYGFPRLTAEQIQLDVKAQAVDTRRRYYEAMGFGGRLEALWRQVYHDGEVYYGPAMYLNRRHSRFALPDFPRLAAGARLGYLRETRFNGFLPSPGYLYNLSGLLNVVKNDELVTELVSALTESFWAGHLLWTGELKLLAIGVKGYSARGAIRFDIPVLSNSIFKDMMDCYVSLRSGIDEYKNQRYMGQSATIGIRYYSLGFIADVAFKVTKAPSDLIDGVPSYEGVDP